MLDYKEKKPMEEIKEKEPEPTKVQQPPRSSQPKPQAPQGSQEVSINRKISEAQSKKYSLNT